jgi:hypothetical protein
LVINPYSKSFKRLHDLRKGNVSAESIPHLKKLVAAHPSFSVRAFDSLPAFRIVIIDDDVVTFSPYRLPVEGYKKSGQGWQAPHVVLDPLATYPLAEAFQWQALPAIRVKGKRAPTLAYRLLAQAPAPPTTLRQHATATEIIGRAAERAMLADALAALMGGTAGVVLIDGEAGIGKSRLIAELAQMLRQRGIV